MDTSKLREIPGWQKEYDGRNICYWTREIPQEVGNPNWNAFSVNIKQETPTVYIVSVDVALSEGLGDLLSADYYTEEQTIESAMNSAEHFANQIEQDYEV